MINNNFTFDQPVNLPKRKIPKLKWTFIMGAMILSSVSSPMEGSQKTFDSEYYRLIIENNCYDYQIASLGLKNRSLSIQLQSPGIIKETMLSRLKEVYDQHNFIGWDGYNGHPIEEQSFLNAKTIIENTSDNILNLWSVFPSPNGTISFQFKEKGIGGVSIGNEKFSYAAMNEISHEILMDKKPFNVKEASEILDKISVFLGYN